MDRCSFEHLTFNIEEPRSIAALSADLPLPHVSIVMPCYLGTAAQVELLDETLRTVSTRTCLDYEVIVVDDGSSISVAPLADTHPRTVTVHEPNNPGA